MKLKAIISSLVLLVVASANANAALTGASGNNLGFSYYNGIDTSYVLDLGVSLSSIIDGTSGNFSTNVVTDINNALGMGTIVDTSTGFFTALGISTDITAPFNSFVTATTTGTELNALTPASVDVGGVGLLNNYLNDSNNTNGANVSTAADGISYWAFQPGGFQGSFNGLFTPASGLVGTALDLVLFEVTFLGDFINPATFAQTVLGSLTLDASGNLNFTSAAPIPLPAAVWLFGTALAGLIGFGRRRAAQVVA